MTLGDVDPAGVLVGSGAFVLALAVFIVGGVKAHKPVVKVLMWVAVSLVAAGFVAFIWATIAAAGSTSPTPDMRAIPDTSVPPTAESSVAPVPTSPSVPLPGADPPVDDGSGYDSPNGGATESPAFSEQYLSKMSVADYNRDSSTGQWGEGSRTIAGKDYGHSIAMNAGCQNDDGGDFWVDYSIGDKWSTFTAVVGISDSSSTESSGEFRVMNAITGAVLSSGKISAGPGVEVNANLAGVSRIRLFINDPNAPNQYCGFEKIRTVVVWGDAKVK